MIFAKQRCWICHQEEPQSYSWASLSMKQNALFICESCVNQLVPLSGTRCLTCSRMLEELPAEYICNQLCNDCVRWEQQERWKGVLDFNVSCYKYNTFLKELISRYKYRGDYALVEVFASTIRTILAKHSYDLIAPIPLSEARLLERGFNQSEAFIKSAHLTPAHLLTRIHTEKQSKKSRQQRMELEHIFQLQKGVNVMDKKIMLLDDIYTTGSTLRYAAEVLKQAGAKIVFSVTVAR